jgi:sodium/proline symporter
MLFLGFASYKKADNFSTYVLGNRSISAIVIGFSYLASEVSVGTFTVAVSMIYKSGLTRIWIDIGFFIFTILCWQLIAKRLRFYSENMGNSLTIPQYLSNRFENDLVGVISSLVITFFITIYIAANLLGFAKVMSNIFELPNYISYGTGFLIILIYVVIGGFKATCFTDVAQGIIMLIASIILPIVLTYKLGADQLLVAFNAKSQMIMNTDFTNGLLYLGFGACLFGSPHTITRFMAISSSEQIKKARNISIILNVVMYTGIAISAMYSIVVFNQVNDSEVILFQLSKMFLHPILGALVITAIIAAMMSTVDSQLILCSSCLTNDIYKKLTKNHSDKHLIKVARIFTVLISIVALIISFYYNQSVLKLGIFALTGLGSSLGPIIIVSLYGKKISASSAIFSILSGAILTIVYSVLIVTKDLHHNLLPIFCVSTSMIFIISYFSTKTDILRLKMEKTYQAFKSI